MESKQIVQIDDVNEKSIDEEVKRIKEIIRKIHKDSEAMEQAHQLADSS